MSSRRNAFRAPELIAKKRDGLALSKDELHWLVRAFVKGEVADYQMSAFAMAVLFRGMTLAETAALTTAMVSTGKVLGLSSVPGPKIDKHSTGGVGDKVSLCLAPIVAACGVKVPMMSGRGLGHTGGTLDKLEAIPGFSVDLPLGKIPRQLKRIGCAMVAASPEIAPADKRLYALRDVTATVESIPLITASILSKKIAEGIDGLVLDVKVGRGAFMGNLAQARALARSLVDVGSRAGKSITAVLTDMEAPLGRAVGNALEVREACEVLHGKGPPDLAECTHVLAVEMLLLAKLASSPAEARRQTEEAVRSGAAAGVMEDVIRAQGGDSRVVREPDRLPKAPATVEVRSTEAGFIGAIDAKAIGLCAVALGAGRNRIDDSIDPAVGLVIAAPYGSRVEPGGLLATVHAASGSSANAAIERVRNAFRLTSRRPRRRPLVLETKRH